MLGWMPEPVRAGVVDFSKTRILAIVVAFYRLGDLLYARNDEVSMLRNRTGKPVLLMKRGIDTTLFSPEKRSGATGCCGSAGSIPKRYIPQHGA
jgi:hypothetical protein